jgi:transglutaminase-like putative cysteine protease
MRKPIPFLLALVTAAAALPQQPAAPVLPMPIVSDEAVSEEAWMAIFWSGQHAGYYHSVTRKARDAKGQPWWHGKAARHLVISRLGTEIPVDIEDETFEKEGQGLEAFSCSMNMGILGKMDYRGLRQGQNMRIVGTSEGRSYEQIIPWGKDVLSPQAEEKRFRERVKKGEKAFAHKVFNSEQQKPVTVTYAVGNFEQTPVLGRAMRLRKVMVTMDVMPEFPSYAWFDEQGEVIKVEANFGALGTVEMHRCEKSEAVPSGAAEVMLATLVYPKAPIPGPYEASSITYRLAFRAGGVKPELPNDGHQTLAPKGPVFQTLTARRLDAPRAPVAAPGVPKREIPGEFLKGNMLIQSDDPEIQKMAQRVTVQLSSDSEKARALTLWVFRRIEKKNLGVGFASAKEVFSRPEGDCTEHAVLLAAMLRAAGIPSRVAVGMVYSETMQAFGYHMWTEALLDGKWFGLDATLGRAGVTATHIKFGDSSLAVWPDMTLLNGVMAALQNMELQVTEVKS